MLLPRKRDFVKRYLRARGRLTRLRLGAYAALACVVWTGQVAGQSDGATTDRSDWSAWYVGGQVGYSAGRVTGAPPTMGVGQSSTTFGRMDGGLHVGRNDLASSRIVLGAEADIAFPGFFEDGAIAPPVVAAGGTVTRRLDFISSLRGRLGYASGRWLFYGTAGATVSQLRVTDSVNATGAQFTTVHRPLGWVAGAGAQVAVARGWTARVEYLYNQLGSLPAAFPASPAIASHLAVQGLRLGLSRSLGGMRERAPISPAPQPAAAPRWNVHGQATFVEQGYFAFRSPYEGANSLSGNSQVKNTASATAFLGLRLWPGGALYFNPEIDQGFGLNDTHGVAAFPNGEAQKASFPMPRFVVDRLILRQTVGLGGPQEIVADAPNQLAEARDISRVTFVAGRLAVTDYFDGNAYANDPRTNFLNWNLFGAGAYDWTMDQLSWTWGALADFNQKHWAFRLGYFLLPVVSSNNSFDMHIPERGEYASEFEWRYAVRSRPGTLRFFGWVNRGTMGAYAAAVALPASTPNYPDIALTREVRTNPGVVVNVQQAVTMDLGLFSRASWSPGRVEILGGTDDSQSLSLGTLVRGAAWGRPRDNLGVAGVVGGLSPVARSYFAAGGLGILIGDGALNYRAEKVAEAFYTYALGRGVAFSLDYQFVADPAYNADRGPVSIYAIRAHAEF